MKQSYKSVVRPARHELWIEGLKGAKACLLSFPFLLPCLAASVTWIGTFIMGKVDTELIGISALGGLGAGLVLLSVGFPVLFVKRTAAPCTWQRFCRFYLLHVAKYMLFIMLLPGTLLLLLMSTEQLQAAKKERTYFKYWLSHPDEDPSPEQCEKIVLIDTDSFDWQDPSQWPDLKKMCEENTDLQGLPTKEII